MTLTFQKKLEDHSGLKLKLKINDNRSTMLSVKWEPDCTKVSLHRMFLDAPRNVMEALACYLRQEDKCIAQTVKAFIEDRLKNMDYSHKINRLKLYSQGDVYNLDEIYNRLNKEYFDQSLNLHITWFGKSNRRCRTRFTMGLFYDPLKLIKINKMLDAPSFPEYLVSYVVYHEMVHHVCPSYYDENGHHQIHSKEFKQKEREYRYYNLAQEWIKKNQTNFFFM